MVKEDAPELLRKELSSRNWKPQLVAISGDTDCYQPMEDKSSSPAAAWKSFSSFAIRS